MEDRGNFGRERTSEAYTSEQVLAVLREIGVSVEGETANDWLALCPLHGNKNTPSFSVSRHSGYFICFNASCDERGTLVELVKRLKKYDEFAARRLIIKNKRATDTSFSEQLGTLLTPKVDFVEFSQAKLDEMYKTFWEFPPAVYYMTEERGFEEETLHKFKVGFSSAQDMIAVPMHDPKGMPVGIIGRPASKENKRFKNSKRLPTSKTLFNLHRAKRHGSKVILVEASFDAMRIDQSGFPNVVASLGGNFSPYHAEQLDRHFDTIIYMTDMDKKQFNEDCAKCRRQGLKLCRGHNPGRDLANKVIERLPNKNHLWASYDEGVVYPHSAKDASDMTDDEIRQCLRNVVPNWTYRSWGIY